VAQLVEAMGRKVACSIPDGRIFHRRDFSALILTPESTRPLTLNGARNISWEAKKAGA
jgi:hypothetical protein